MIRPALVLLLVATSVSFVVPAVAATPRTGTVTGTVVDQTGAPIVGAEVDLGYLIGQANSVTTDAAGHFAVSIGEGSYTSYLSVTVETGGRDQTIPVELRKGRSVDLGTLAFSSTPTITGTTDVSSHHALYASLVDRAGHEVVSQFIDNAAKGFAFTWANPGIYTVRISGYNDVGWTYLGDTGAFEHAKFVSVGPTSALTAAFTVTKTKTGTLSGRIAARTTPKKGTTASLSLVRIKGSDLDVALTTPSATKFTEKGLPTGAYRVTSFTGVSAQAITLHSKKTTTGKTHFTVHSAKKTKLGTILLPASYFQEGWGE